MIQAFSKSILVIDDNSTNLKHINEILKTEYKVYLSPSGERAMIFLKSNIPDLILLDVEMPGMNGYQVLAEVKANPLWASIPVIFLTGLENEEKEEKALTMGALDYIVKPVIAGVLKRRVQTQLELESYRKNLELLVANKTEQLTKTKDAILDILSNVTAFRDNETGAHIMRTTQYAKLIVKAMQECNDPDYHISDIYANDIIKSAKLHDIGKVAIPDSVLLKPARLSPAEFEMIKKHTIIGAKMIENAMRDLGTGSSFLKTAYDLVLTHHECWDGSGYPNGLVGSAIPLSGRVMAIADVYDALITRRHYKPAFTHNNAMFIIKNEAQNHFDGKLIQICENIFPEFAKIAEEISESEFLDLEWKSNL